jgi:hypothetical protein
MSLILIASPDEVDPICIQFAIVQFSFHFFTNLLRSIDLALMAFETFSLYIDRDWTSILKSGGQNVPDLLASLDCSWTSSAISPPESSLNNKPISSRVRATIWSVVSWVIEIFRNNFCFEISQPFRNSTYFEISDVPKFALLKIWSGDELLTVQWSPSRPSPGHGRACCYESGPDSPESTRPGRFPPACLLIFPFIPLLPFEGSISRSIATQWVTCFEIRNWLRNIKRISKHVAHCGWIYFEILPWSLSPTRQKYDNYVSSCLPSPLPTLQLSLRPLALEMRNRSQTTERVSEHATRRAGIYFKIPPWSSMSEISRNKFRSEIGHVFRNKSHISK